jgi:hypothetical protein
MNVKDVTRILNVSSLDESLESPPAFVDPHITFSHTQPKYLAMIGCQGLAQLVETTSRWTSWAVDGRLLSDPGSLTTPDSRSHFAQQKHYCRNAQEHVINVVIAHVKACAWSCMYPAVKRHGGAQKLPENPGRPVRSNRLRRRPPTHRIPKKRNVRSRAEYFLTRRSQRTSRSKRNAGQGCSRTCAGS